MIDSSAKKIEKCLLKKVSALQTLSKHFNLLNNTKKWSSRQVREEPQQLVVITRLEIKIMSLRGKELFLQILCKEEKEKIDHMLKFKTYKNSFKK